MAVFNKLERIFVGICEQNPKFVCDNKRTFLIEVSEEAYVSARDSLDALFFLKRRYGTSVEENLPVKMEEK